MAIAEMTQVLILGRKRDQLEVVKALQNAGVVHMDPVEGADLPKAQLTGADATLRAGLERQLARSESALAAVGGGNVTPDALRLRAISNREAFLDEIGGSADTLAQQKADLDAELSAANLYANSAKAAAELAGSLDKSNRVGLLAFMVADSDELVKLEAALKDANVTYSLGHKQSGSTSTAVLAVRKEDLTAGRTALSRAGLGELRFPGKFENLSFSAAASAMDDRMRSAPSELTRVNTELNRIKSEHAGTVAQARLELRDEIGQYQALETGVAGKYGFALRGWVPNDNRSKLETFLLPMKDRLVYEFEGAPTHHASHVPVKLVNNPIFKPFELLLAMFAPPAYGAFDPTWVLAVCFPLFFGFVIGDIGFGLVALAVALLFRNMAQSNKTLDLGPLGIAVPPKPLMNLSTVLTWMAAWSIVFGFAYGELFGSTGENLGMFHVVKKEVEVNGVKSKQAVMGFFNAPEKHEEGKAYEFNWPTDKFPDATLAREYHEERHHGIPILLPRVKSEFANFMMTLAIIPGILQVLFGWFLRFKAGNDHHDDKHKWEGLGMFLGVLGVVVFAYGFRNPGTSVWANPIAAVCMLGFVVGAVLTFRKDGMLGAMMPIEILSNGGNILSYLRLYAVGLSSAILANLATDTGWNLGASLGPIGLILGILAATFVHLFAIVFTIIGHVLQPLRLHYAEFFTKFGFYEESGRPYKPFARVASVDLKNAGD
jgi:V/A-type H+/Na+-transporting ATPase subunit I